jgi:hypothetical protein
MAILCHRWWPLQESVFFALEGEPVLDAGHALYCSTYYSRAVSVARSHIVFWLFCTKRKKFSTLFFV